MQRNSVLTFLFVLIGATASAQTLFSRNLEGKVYSKDGDVSATHVLNITTQRASITDANGFFSIPARLNDTLVFSAVQFKRKEIVVSMEMLESKMLSIPLEDALTELDEVIVMPYNLTGDIARDAERMGVGPISTASTLGLPNADVKVLTKTERELFAATANPFMSFDPLINAITGRTKMLKDRLAYERKYARTERVRDFYVDSLFRVDFKIPEAKIDDFLYFCEVDPTFQKTVDSHDVLKIWEYMRGRSIEYRKNNDLVDIELKDKN